VVTMVMLVGPPLLQVNTQNRADDGREGASLTAEVDGRRDDSADVKREKAQKVENFESEQRRQEAIVMSLCHH